MKNYKWEVVTNDKEFEHYKCKVECGYTLSLHRSAFNDKYMAKIYYPSGGWSNLGFLGEDLEESKTALQAEYEHAITYQRSHVDIDCITDWFKKAVPSPDTKAISVQYGCHLEEIAEMLDVISNFDAAGSVSDAALEYKNGTCVLHTLSNEDKVALLDSLCDQIVTAVGVAHMYGFDISGALGEVMLSNWSKFENGGPVFDDNGKIKKGKDYKKPELEEFIGNNYESI